MAGSAGAAGNKDGVAQEATFNHPHGLALDGRGALLVADADNSSLRKVQLASGAVSTVVGVTGRAVVKSIHHTSPRL